MLPVGQAALVAVAAAGVRKGWGHPHCCGTARVAGAAGRSCAGNPALTATSTSKAELISFLFHAVLEIVEELLLRPDDGPRATNTAQCDGLRGGVAVVLHDVQGDVGSGSAETGLAVDGDCPLFSIGKADPAST